MFLDIVGLKHTISVDTKLLGMTKVGLANVSAMEIRRNKVKANNEIDMYDVNVWCNEEGVLMLTAVELKEDGDNYQSNYAKTITLDIPMDEENASVIAYLLDNENWQDQKWMDYDYWDTTNWLLEEESPFFLKVWARSLPYYTPEKVGA